MSAKAAITVRRSRDEVERLWQSPGYRPSRIDEADAAVTFADAPGDRGTEIHVDLDHGAFAGKLGGIAQRLAGSARLPMLKDDLRHFKQKVETGEVPRSEASPEGESAGRKLKQRPAQPLDESEMEKMEV
jgi:uncharacterized membrane protein